MKKFPCPSCGAEVQFRAAHTPYSNCVYCGTLVQRNDVSVASIGNVGLIQDDCSPLQLGTSGVYDGVRFTIIGRIKVAWVDGYWNEWYVLFDNGKDAWLGEAQGFIAINFEQHPKEKLPARNALDVLKHYVIEGVRYQIDDMRIVTCVACEGELPTLIYPGENYFSVDLSAPQGVYACLNYNKSETTCFSGRYMNFEDFKFSYLREFEGWDAPRV